MCLYHGEYCLLKKLNKDEKQWKLKVNTNKMYKHRYFKLISKIMFIENKIFPF